MSNDSQYISDHMELFGHYPIPDLATGQGCCHPSHDTLTRLMNGPGVELDVDFMFRSMVSDDDPIFDEYHRKYGEKVQEYKDRIQEIEAEDERERNGKRQF